MNMRKLNTIQIHEKLNSVYAVDGKGPGGASHSYIVVKNSDDIEPPLTEIKLQCGPRKEETSTCGVIDSDLLEIVRDRLIAFQEGPYACDYNAEALLYIESALHALNRRVEDRIQRNVLGSNNK